MSAAVDAPEPDPALVAASGPAASTLLGARAPAAAGAGDGSITPVDGMPAPAGAAAPAAGTRYADVGIAVLALPDATEIVHLRRRLLPDPAALPTVGWDEVADGDRVDTIAARALGDPSAWWRLCDAAGVTDPAELETPGRLVRLTLPEGF